MHISDHETTLCRPFQRYSKQCSLLGALAWLLTQILTGTSDICLTPECVHAASEILYNLSPDYQNIDPCTDFEELVCGGWRERHDLRPDQGDAFTGTIMSETSQTLLRHILESPYPGSSAVGLDQWLPRKQLF